MDPVLIINIAIAILVIIIALSGIKQIQQGQAAVIERLGKYHKTLEAGLSFIIPFFDRQKFVRNVNARPHELANNRIDLREQIMDIPEQEVISKDNIRMQVDTLVFFQIVEPYKAVYEISSPVKGIQQLSQTTIRNIFGEMDLDTSLSARESINDRLRSILDEATDKWGIKVLRVEIQDIIPPIELKEAMQKQMIAERERRAKVTLAEAEKQERILTAEGQRQKQILEAEGENQAVILKAEAERKKKILEAEGQSKSIQMVQEATAKGLDAVRVVLGKAEGIQGVVLIETLKAQQEIAKALASGENSKFFLPNDLAGLFGAIGGIKEVLDLSKDISAKQPKK
ncbi:peptidase [candidate division LCP-89 bacterium B3_LCP]|uniref:Protein QmcA n=1 Tax=candidate division LCP-89 bacterium B3_LCP TaxID=2012998 RepID=A0A532UPT8_UNCL8|nr:MAG: peptidase [candidate division LCP-89 bacterium B3_LCP]